METISAVITRAGVHLTLLSIGNDEAQGYAWFWEGGESPLFAWSDPGLDEAFEWLNGQDCPA